MLRTVLFVTAICKRSEAGSNRSEADLNGVNPNVDYQWITSGIALAMTCKIPF
jgi:hypothetical protein